MFAGRPELLYASLYEVVRLLACAVTASDRGDIGLIVGSIGIGAAPDDGPLFQVVLLLAAARVLATGISAVAFTVGEGRGAMFSLPAAGVVTVAVLSERPINDFLNQDCLDEDVGVISAESLDPR